MTSVASANFQFLQAYSAQLERLGALAEYYFKNDPNTCLLKLRQFSELLAQTTAAKAGLFESENEPQADLLRRLKLDRILPNEIADLFHQLRISGNRANHQYGGDYAEALTGLKIARQLAIWFHRTFSTDRAFAPGPFTPPPDPAAAGQALQEELLKLRRALEETQTEAARARQASEEEQGKRARAEDLIVKEREERAAWEQLAQETEQAHNALAAQLAVVQATAPPATPTQSAAIANQAEQAAALLELDETATRAIIDEQLRTRGWEADSEKLRFALGTRPAKGRNMAIAEWPTRNGPADYALFVGTQCISLVEAKRRNKNVSAVLSQAERYAAGFETREGVQTSGGPWGEYAVPFVFSANGRPYLKQLETQSGIWFRNTRRPVNLARALSDWPTPDGLKGMLEIDVARAEHDLKVQAFNFGFPLRPYQKQAIDTVEAVPAADRRAMLLTMATGTGKTKLAIALLYRLLSAKRFRR